MGVILRKKENGTIKIKKKLKVEDLDVWLFQEELLVKLPIFLITRVTKHIEMCTLHWPEGQIKVHIPMFRNACC